MIYFIGLEDDFSRLREQIFENTVSILKLFEQRANLSKQVSEIKRKSNREIRDRRREIDVIKAFDHSDKFTTGILSYLFEFSIDFQLSRIIHLPWETVEKGGEEYSSINGERNQIDLIAGILLGNFGQNVYSLNTLPNNFEIGLAIRGSHIIKGEYKDDGIFTVCIGNSSLNGDAFLIYSKNTAELLVRSDKLAALNKKDIKVIS